ncbi:MAG TPA: DUF4307 domain-containing protein [Propionibacteriaceae bacterium]|nr:DUF4307 domain-containing protein [Propionibacteriaceae bacterium]
MPAEAPPEPSSDAAERLRLRYPSPRLPRPVVIMATGLLGVVFLGWLLWSANAHSQPPVSGQVLAYRVLSDQEVAVTVTVQRADPSRAAVCLVIAQAEDFQIVGALDRLAVPPRTEPVVDLRVTIKTLRRATSASVKSCSLA